eukprot:gnl/TRDRNA2_/TRDRNA2_175602_c1_seq3.p1 gnl/TRDRNA2_/TRDRNA2_175602_c1~~gnl/TRDRNA2_/TRDRNA2_175602_c1_seq3.p1  ORF type:complete len:142 (-),score=13.18 gnl/TRDRNA2_/TRDRNA2_175602_c1_seq3:329-721(-)
MRHHPWDELEHEQAHVQPHQPTGTNPSGRSPQTMAEAMAMADIDRHDAAATEVSRMPVSARIPACHRMPVATRDTTRCTDTCREAAREDDEDLNIAQDLGVEGLVHLTPRALTGGCSSKGLAFRYIRSSI